MNKTILIPLLALCAATLFSCKGNTEQAAEAQYVKTAKAVRIGDTAEVSYPGKTKPAEEVNVAFRVSGPVQKVLVKEGDYVKKGQLIAVMDPRDYQVQLTATKAEYEQVKADAERVIAMYKEQSTTASNYDKARFGLQQISEKLANHRNQLADTKLRAPISGYVQAKLHEAGETVAAGMPVVTMFSSGDVEIEIHVPASDYARRNELTSGYCSFDVFPNERFPLQISRFDKTANASQLYSVRLKIKGDYDKSRLTPGMTTMVYATYDAPNVKGLTLVPTSAVLHKGGKSVVYVVDRQRGIASERAVEVGSIDLSGNIQIRSGLRPGETVVTAGVRHLSDGAKVKEVAPTSEANVGGLL